MKERGLTGKRRSTTIAATPDDGNSQRKRRRRRRKTVGIVYRVRHLLNRPALFILYCSLFLPYLTCCAEIWGNTYKSNIQCIFLLQKKIVRIVYGANFKDHTDVIFQDLIFFNFMI